MKYFDAHSHTYGSMEALAGPMLGRTQPAAAGAAALPAPRALAAFRLRPTGLYGRYAKPIIDRLLILASLPIALPIIALCALALWIESGQPFYTQQRLGRGGKRFSILKLRTMVRDADAVLESYLAANPAMRAEWDEMQKLKDDPRITRVGAFLRATSLDELPQLWNVLKGEMSLVGPRPERPAFVREFKHKVPQYMQRHRVRAGITGWAQVHGWRGNTSIRRRIQYDIYYIENWSLMLDFKILWMTLRNPRIQQNAN